MAHSFKKTDLANAVSVASGLGMPESRAFVESYFKAITEFLVKDGEVKIMHLGTFIKKHKAERVGRNPKTGAPAVIKARNCVLFHPAKTLREE